MLLYLVRHGESTWNAEHRVIGAATTPPLTDRGRSQAAEAAGRLRGTGARTLLASDLVRAAPRRPRSSVPRWNSRSGPPPCCASRTPAS